MKIAKGLWQESRQKATHHGDKSPSDIGGSDSDGTRSDGGGLLAKI
jgi:hypothetical protein